MGSDPMSSLTDDVPQLAAGDMDDPDDGVLHPPVNKGREAMAYLTFLIDHYDKLPTSVVVVHPHLERWPTAWHTDIDGHNNVKSIQSLRLDYL